MAAVAAEIAARKTRVDTYPFEVQFSTEHRCNLRCIQCGSTIHRNHGIVPLMDRKLPVRALERFRKLDAVLPSLEWLSLTGSGEPLISPDLPAILAHARQHDCAVAFNTNGTLWTQERADMVVDLGVTEIRFSIDGATKATFERIRVNARFEKVCEAVRMLVATRQRKGKQRPKVSFSSNLMRMSIEELPGIVDLAADLGAATVYANNTIVYESAMADEALARHPELTLRMVREATARAAARGIELVNNLADVTGEASSEQLTPSAPARAEPSTPTTAAAPAPAPEPPVPAGRPSAQVPAPALPAATTSAPGMPPREPARFELPKSPCADESEPTSRNVESILQPLPGLPADLPDIVHACTRPWTGLYVENDGYVRVCCFEAPAIGNLDEQSFEEIWNGPHAQHLRRSFLEGKPPEACANCFIFAKYQKSDKVFVRPYETGKSFVDVPGIESKLYGVFPVQGWAIEPDGVARVEVLLDGQSLGAVSCERDRPDVAAAYPGFADGARCGFLLEVDATKLPAGDHTLRLVVHTRTGHRRVGTERLVQVVH
jgi:radical SAM protein with 4Fe4S-binding SPASM domain